MTNAINASAQSALSLLNSGSASQEKTLNQISSGKKVDSPDDNAAYWAIAKMMKADSVSMTAASDAVGFSKAITDVSSMAMSAATDIVSDIRSKLVIASSMTSGRAAVNSEIGALKDQLKSVTDAAGFSGENWLKLSSTETPTTKSMVASVTKDSDGNVSVKTIGYDTSGSVLISQNNAGDGLLTAGNTVTTGSGSTYTYHLLDANSATPPAASTEISVSDSNSQDEIDGMIAATDTVLSGLTDAGAKMGATQNTLDAQDDYLSALNDAVVRGTGKLTDSNVEQDATKLKSQDVQTQLQTSMLNIINANAKSVLDLFR